ncbi:MAG: hydroxylamine reductase [Nitrospira bacterium SG8_35_4]|nr:MAG: hydroxylamine reductase [Nitrospira bacterium SG8_35_4]
MFCNQCEQVAKGGGCTKIGTCGKKPDVAALQDLLVHSLKGLSLFAVEGRKAGIRDKEVNEFTMSALFATLTNVNFDPEQFVTFINRSVTLRDRLREQVRKAGGRVDFQDDAATFVPEESIDALVKQGEGVTITPGEVNDDIASLEQTTLYGLKGIAAYAYHALALGQSDDAVYAYAHEALASMLNRKLSLEDWVGIALKCGEINLKTMELLDAAHTGRYGHPVPTEVPLGAKKGKALLVSGHDLYDLEHVLKQTEGKGIFVYTHGEMLPTHGYPELKKYPHFYGHYGTAWQNQHKEFAEFPGAVVMTTNCLQKPHDSYKDNVFTCGVVGWPGITHIENNDYTPAINRALELPGFKDDVPGKTVMTGFARNAVMGVADKVIEAVKGGAIRHFFLVAGCDGAKPGRNYYTEFVEKVPSDCVVLTLACGKFRFFDKELGAIGGIPRLLDIGQCNDAYSAVQIALALSKAFGVSVNELPLSLVLSWYEQKAVAILLSLLHLGIRDIRLGPTLPSFLTPNVLNYLVQNFDIKPITTPDEDLAAILSPAGQPVEA